MKVKVFSVAFTLALVLLVYLVSQTVSPTELELWVKKAGIFAPVLLIILTIVTGVLAPLSGTPINLAGFILYGANSVFLFAVSGIISAIINFYIAKRWGRPLIKRFIGRENMSAVDKFTQEHGVISLLFMRIFLGGVHDFLSYAMGLTSMKFRPYMAASVSGILIGTLIWYAIALQTKTPLAFLAGTLLFATVFSGVYGLYRFAERVANKRRKR